jgi:hypothetical protein
MRKALSCLMFTVVLLVLGHTEAWGASCSPSASFSKIMNDPVYGSIAQKVCRSEGNCNANGTITQAYCGHKDSGNGKWNIGFCSNQNGPATLQARDESCLNRFIKPGFAAHSACPAARNDPDGKILFTFIDVRIQGREQTYNKMCSCVGRKFTPNAAAQRLIRQYNIDPNDPMLSARMCAYLEGGTTLNVSRDTWPDCAGKTPENCATFWRDQARRMSASGSGGVSGILSLPSLTNQEPQNIANITCFSCGLIKAVVKISADLGEDIFNGLRGTLVTLIGVVIALIMLYKIGTLFLPFGPTDNVSKVINQEMYLAGVGLMLSIVLSSMTYFWEYVYIPVLQASVDISDVVLQSTNIAGYSSCSSSISISGTPQEQNALLADRIECQTKNIVEGISQGMRVGWAMIASVVHYPVNSFNDVINMNLIKNMLLIFSAIPIISVYFYASLKFLFAMIDVVWRWTFICMISPLMIASYVTKQTRSFFSFGMKAMFESLVAFAMMSVVAAVTASLIANMDVDANYKNLATLNTPQKYIDAVQAGYVYAPTINRAAFWNITFIGLLCGGLLFQCRDLAGRLVSSMTGGAAGDFGGSILNRGNAGNLANNTLGRAASGDEQRFLQDRVNERQAKAYPTPPPTPPNKTS